MYRRNILKAGGGVLGLGVLGATPASAQEQGARSSGKFQLHETAEMINEPGVRPTNHVVRIDTSEDGLYGSASRHLGVDAGDLDGKLSFDYKVVEGDTGGGSPRLILSIDDDGDGNHDFYLVTDGSGSPGWQSCPGAPAQWQSFDATDDGDTYWRIHPGGGYYTWTDAKAQLSEDHTVLSGALVDDSYWKDCAAGITYYDDVQIGDRTLSGNSDVVGPR